MNTRKLFSQLWASLGWNETSYTLMSVFIATILLIIVVWWPLVEEYIGQFNPAFPLWMQIDWLLVGIFIFMSLMIMARADLRQDLPVVAVGLVGGLVIESWGTQTSLWTYYTNERPPLWIIPAWPIASLAIDRCVRFLNHLIKPTVRATYRFLYVLTFSIFSFLMLVFVSPTLDKSLTWMSLLLCALLIATPTDYRLAVFTFLAGAGLGYFLEVWGTTRLCWTYYTLETPPLFAVLAHGMAAVAFWRARLVLQSTVKLIRIGRFPSIKRT